MIFVLHVWMKPVMVQCRIMNHRQAKRVFGIFHFLIAARFNTFDIIFFYSLFMILGFHYYGKNQ
ncbi:hypothetical protein Barb6_03161 [Bacteroidales bacterium Barb6]|nr:hypothetical protein Barb6_03161 [Bacteroidales bacterium Barb6]